MKATVTKLLVDPGSRAVACTEKAVAELRKDGDRPTGSLVIVFGENDDGRTTYCSSMDLPNDYSSLGILEACKLKLYEMLEASRGQYDERDEVE